MTTATADAKITEGLRAEEFRAATERAAVFPQRRRPAPAHRRGRPRPAQPPVHQPG